MQHVIFLDAISTPLTRRIQTINKAVDEARLLHLRARPLLVIPVLVVVKLRPVLPESRPLNRVIATQFISKRAWFIIGIEASIVEVDIAVSS